MAAVERALSTAGAPPAWWLDLLVDRRAVWNAAAAAARSRGARAEALTDALREVGAALAAAAPHPAARAALADALVLLAVDLVAAGRWSPGSAERAVLLGVPVVEAHAGRRAERAGVVAVDLVAAAGRVRRWGDAAAWQRRLLAAATTPGARAAAAAHPHDADLLRGLGVVAAWRSGCARLRRAALGVARALPPDAARAALSLPDADTDTGTGVGVGDDALAAVLDRHAVEPWWWPGTDVSDLAGGHDRAALRVVARLGGFRGFGGPWARPPRVLGALAGDGSSWEVAVADPGHPGRDQRWRVVADVHGSAVHRHRRPADTDPAPLVGPVATPPGLALPWDDEITGAAVAGATTVLSRAHSHLLDVLVAAR